MFSIPHLIIVFVVALVVFGPEKLPELARNLGKLMGEFRKATGDLRSTFEGHLRDLEREAEQRRIASPAPAASLPAASATPYGTSTSENSTPLPSSASTAAMDEEISTALAAASGAPGTVPTTPPHLGIGTPVAEPKPAEPQNADLESSASGHPAPPSNIEPQHNPESLTDAGTHPA